jgi:O-antigen/teichoic acid export membrane protein
MNSVTLRDKVVSGFFWLAATKALGQAISWLITLLVVRLLAPQDYGLMGLAVLVNSFLLLFNELGLGTAIIQKPDLTRRHLSDLRWVILFVNIGLFALVLMIAPVAARYFEEPALARIVRTMGVVFVISGIGAPSAFMLIRSMAFRKKSQAELIGNVAGGVTTLLLALAQFGVWSLIGGYLISQAVTNALYCLYSPIPIDAPKFARSVRGSLQFGSQIAMTKVLWWISASADSVVVGKMLGTVQLGFYGLAVQFASIPLEKIVSLITQLALPSFAALQHDKVRLRRYYLKLVNTIAFITFPVFVGFIVVADGGVRLLLTEKWIAIIVPLKILCFASALRAIETMNTPLLVASGRPGIPLFNSLLQAIVLPVAFVIGTKWGINGVAVAWVISWPLLYLVVTGQTIQVMGMSVGAYLGCLRHPALASATMALAVYAVQQFTGRGPSPLLLSIECATGAVTYAGYHAVFNRETLRDVLETLKLRKRGDARRPTDGAGPEAGSLPTPHTTVTVQESA